MSRNIRLLIILVSVFFFGFGSVSGESIEIDGTEWKSPKVGSVGRAPLRNEFISYDTREAAEKGDRNGTEYYVPLPMNLSSGGGQTIYTTQFNIPFMWEDRDIFLHVEGLESLYVDINGRRIAYSQDSRCPSEFLISPYITDGTNTIIVYQPNGSVDRVEPQFFIYSQPKVRIEDYKVVTTADSTGNHRVFDIEVSLSNSYNSPQTFMVGFDVYAPTGKLQTYDVRQITVDGNGRDTMRFRELIYHATQNLWSTNKPNLYRVMVYIKRGGRIVEYVPFKVGFGSVDLQNGVVRRNAKPIKIDAVSYNSAPTLSQTKTEIKVLKDRGVNTVWVDYPQSYWFYDLCDEVGMNVVDQPNVVFTKAGSDNNVALRPSNNPLWENSFLERTSSMYARSRAHACIIGWSLGGAVGNGYNMYKTYQWLKGQDTQRAVMFIDANGEWNSDLKVSFGDKKYNFAE